MLFPISSKSHLSLALKVTNRNGISPPAPFGEGGVHPLVFLSVFLCVYLWLIMLFAPGRVRVETAGGFGYYTGF